ncbi:hypothetical protein TNCV_3072331 [Trichonephila clavipes]|nr:hypothetical protein TNCV_3072331 [Trichonephila clavipes]
MKVIDVLIINFVEATRSKWRCISKFLRPSDENGALAGTLFSKTPHHVNARVSASREIYCSTALPHGEYSTATGLEPETGQLRPQVRDYDHAMATVLALTNTTPTHECASKQKKGNRNNGFNTRDRKNLYPLRRDVLTSAPNDSAPDFAALASAFLSDRYCRIYDDPGPICNISIIVTRPSSSCQVIYSQFGLAIHQNDHQARRRFVEWAQSEIAVVRDFHRRILFSDEAHFWLNGYVNKQNCRIWSEANPQVYVETPLHPEKLTVWCALWAGGILQKR